MLTAALSADEAAPAAASACSKESLRAERAALRKRFEQDGNTAQLLRRHRLLVDGILRSAWREHAIPERL